MPELAKQHTAEGAQAFVQYWFDTGTYAVLSGDTAPIRSVSLDNCKACSGVIDQVQEQYALGGRFIDFSAKIRSPAAAPPDSQGVVVTLGLDESALVGVAPDGARSTLAPADSTDSVTFFAQWVDGHWSAYEIAKD